MLRNWPVLFIVIPLVELYLIIEVGSRIGALWTVLIVIMTAVIGVQLLRLQGFSTLRRAQQSMAQGAMPAMEMMEGMVLAVGGALLITPGFITDALGFLCLIPVTRRAMIRRLLAGSQLHMHSHYTGHRPGQHSPGQETRHDEGRTLEGEFHHKDQ